MPPVKSSFKVDSTSFCSFPQTHSKQHTINILTPDCNTEFAFISNRGGCIHKIMVTLFAKVSLLAVFLSIADDILAITSGADKAFGEAVTFNEVGKIKAAYKFFQILTQSQDLKRRKIFNHFHNFIKSIHRQAIPFRGKKLDLRYYNIS